MRPIIYTITDYFCLKCGARCDVIHWSPFGLDVWCPGCSNKLGKLVWLIFGQYRMEVREVKQGGTEHGQQADRR